MVLITQQIVSKFLKLWVGDPGKNPILDPGSRGKKYWILDPDPQYC